MNEDKNSHTRTLEILNVMCLCDTISFSACTYKVPVCVPLYLCNMTMSLYRLSPDL